MELQEHTQNKLVVCVEVLCGIADFLSFRQLLRVVFQMNSDGHRIKNTMYKVFHLV